MKDAIRARRQALRRGRDERRQRATAAGAGLPRDRPRVRRGLADPLAPRRRWRPWAAIARCGADLSRCHRRPVVEARHEPRKPLEALPRRLHRRLPRPDGQRRRYRDIGLDALVGLGIEVEFFARHLPEIAADQLAGPNGAIVLTPRVTADEPRRVPRPARDRPLRRRLRLGRCRRLHRRRRAALHRRRARSIGPWPRRPSAGCSRSRITSARRTGSSARRGGTSAAGTWGRELRDRTLGVIGFGGIGRALVKLLAGFGMKPPLVFDPFVTAGRRDALRRHAPSRSTSCSPSPTSSRSTARSTTRRAT